MQHLLSIGVLICALHISLGIRAQTGSSEAAPTYRGRVLPTGWTGFAEISSGYTGNNEDVAVEGVPSSVKLLGSFYTQRSRGVFDLGLGAHTQTFIDAGAPEDNSSSTVMEAAARYQFENRWQLGIVYNQFFDQGTNYFSDQGDAMFGGLQLMREMSIGDDTNFRVGLRAMMDINTPNEEINMAMLDLAFGWNPR